MSSWPYVSRRDVDRQSVIEWAHAVVLDASAVFLDTETTGIGPGAEVVDLAVVRLDGTVVLDTLIKPRRPIPADASRIHGIYDRDVAGAPSWEQVFPLLLDAIGHRRVVVYNADYDQGVITGCCRACGLNLPLSRWECAMKAYAAYAGEPSTHSRGGYRWFKLDQAARAFGIRPGGHRALADAEACRRLVHSLANVAR